MFGLPPGARQVVVVFERSEDISHKLIVNELCRKHLLQQIMAVPDVDVEIVGEFVHTKIVSYNDGRSNLAKGQDEAIRR